MTIFLSGGCKNGKSTLAQHAAKKLAGDGPLYYIATMIPHDEEDEARIRRHVAERDGMGFITLEQGTDILGDCPCFRHHKYILVFQYFLRGKVILYTNRHTSLQK